MSHAQVKSTITPDGTLGTTVTQSGTVHTITGGTRSGNGPNLFHSFDRFSVGTGETASFTSEQTGIKHIVSRVTGGLRSDIDGQLRTDGQLRAEGANLYLLNPSGVLFGPNARLDASGSFHVSTADYLRLADGARFFARLSETSTLSVAPPVVFGFLGPTPAPITVQGSTLEVPEGQTMSVVGGEAQIVGGTLRAPSGRIQLASVAAAGEVIPVIAGPAPDLQVDRVVRLGRIEIAQNALIDASGNGGGTVLIRGGRLLVNGSNIFADNTGLRDGTGLGVDLRIAADAVITHGSYITTDRYIPEGSLAMPKSLRAGHARDLQLTAGSVSLDDSAIGSRPLASGGDGGKVLVQAGTVTLKGGAISTATDAHSGGNAGSLVMQVGTLTLTDGAQISSSTFGSGQGGNLTVVARDTITLVGQSSQGFSSGLFASAERGSSGNAGALRVEAGALTLSGGAQLSSSTFGPGHAGDIEVTASTVTVTGGAQIRSGTFDSGQGGRVTVRATEAVTLEGTSPDGALASGIRVGPLGRGADNADSSGQVTSTITPDSTLGTAVTPSSTVMVEAPTVTVTGGAQIVGNRTSYEITGGTRLGNGPNLFHSFDRFSVGTNDTARFSGPSGVENILSRVTGGQPSVIDGQLQSTIPGANLYLLNPNGVLFGPNATLDVSGSFHVSTADYLRLADGVRFSAHLSDMSMLSAAPPAAFGFVSPQPATIAVQGSALQVPAGATLSVIGGDIEIVGNGRPSFFGTMPSPFKNIPVTPHEPAISARPPTLGAPGGQLNLASVAAAGEVELAPLEQARALRVDAFERLGKLDIRDAVLDVSGDRGGTVRLRGGRLVIDNAIISALSTGDVDGGGIDIRGATDLTMRNVGSIQGGTIGAGRGGDITVEVGRLTLTDGAEIFNTTNGPGHGGNVSVIATDAMTISGRHRERSDIFLSGLVTNTLGTGEAGHLHISTPTLTMDDGVIQSLTSNNGRAGNIQLEVGSATLTGGAQISSSSGAIDLSTGKLAVGGGQGGEVRINAREVLAISGHDQDGSPSGVFTGTSGSGAAGSVTLSVPRIHLEEGQIESTTTGDGPAGDLMLNVGRLTLAEGARITSASNSPVGNGAGGNITIAATEAVTLTGATSDGAPSALASSTFGSGDAGHIILSTPTLILEEGGTLSARTAGVGQAGDIRLKVGQMTLRNGALITNSTSGAGGGGNVILQAQGLTLTDGARLTAESTGSGDAGNITITTQAPVLLTNGSVVTRATLADGGNIQITTPTLLRLRDSTISAEVGGGARTVGGNITIDPQYVLLQHSQIIANANEGKGGNISIQAQQAFLRDPASTVSASSALGINGQVAIQAPVTSLSGTVAPLKQAFAPTTELLRSRCAERLREGTVSRFVVGGRDGVPLEPGSLLLSPLGQVGQEGGVHGGERGGQNPEEQQEWAWYAQAPAPGGLEAECARWIGQPTVRRKR
jgi:filamentous hemagglutinin family protein